LNKVLYIALVGLVLCLCFYACKSEHEPDIEDYKQLYASKQDLGEALFFDKELSLNRSISCATCHVPEKAFTDGKKVAEGIFGRVGIRNTPTLMNVSKMHLFMFDGRVPTLEMQAIVPIQDSKEMGISMKNLISRLQGNKEYVHAAKKLYGRPFDAFVLTRSLAAFQRTLNSTGSRFDDFYKGDKNALSSDEKMGWKLFSNDLKCIECHPAPDFTIHQPRNNGYLGDTLLDQGRYRATGKVEDKGKFKVPTLRNIAITFPYMHDGGLVDLNAVLDHYSSENRHPNQDKSLGISKLNSKERQFLLSFFYSLTDTLYIAK